MIMVNIPLDEDTHAKFKARCAMEGVTMRDKITELITKYARK